VLIILIVGGCQPVNNNQATTDNSSDEVITKAKTTAVEHFKEKYDLDVEITKEEMMPSIVADKVNLEGFVVDHPEQTFKISVDFNTGETSNFVMNPELRKAIKGE
jgi:hypothetical protein